MSHFRLRELEDCEFEPAFALVRSLAPDVPLRRWLAYARHLKSRGGILGLYGEEGGLFGLLTYRAEECLQLGRVLLVENFHTFELNSSAPGRKALCEAVEALAREGGYSAVQLIVGGRGYVDSASSKLRGWEALGHSADQVVLTKSLAGCRTARRAEIASA